MGLEDFKSEDTPDPSKSFGERMAEMKYGSPNYQNKDWLAEKAEVDNFNDRAIAEMCEVQPATIRKWRVKYDIESGDKYIQRNLDGNLLTEHQLNLVEGSILGDGGIFESGAKHIFKLTNGQLEYLQWVKAMLPDSILTDSSITKTEYDNRTWYDLHTTNHKRLTQLRDKWYNDGKKVLRDGFELNDTSLLHLYLQDGDLSDQYNPRITLSWASKDEFNRLASNVESCISGKVEIHQASNGARTIYIPSDERHCFFNSIDNPMLTCLQYKWPPEFR